nr:GDSL esterase/lipase At5g03610-like [Ipomoea batatas]
MGSDPPNCLCSEISYSDTGNYRNWSRFLGSSLMASPSPEKPSGRFSDGRVLTDYIGLRITRKVINQVAEDMKPLHNRSKKNERYGRRRTGKMGPTHKLFVFGDSYSDTGNYRKIESVSWKQPYGITFPGKPSGRFSDGRVLTDYIAEFLGVKSPTHRQMDESMLSVGCNMA